MADWGEREGTALAGALRGKAFFAETGGAAFRLREAEDDAASDRLKPAPLAVWAATLGAIAPDSDSLFELFGKDELAILDVHRGLTLPREFPFPALKCWATFIRPCGTHQ